MEGLSNLSIAEFEKISNVLKRDRELRALEEARVRQLKQELTAMRKRSALRPGLDPLRNCNRCLAELGRILNRGAACPLCLKKVCKSCRKHGDENNEWMCIYCYKQAQLKAISGEWMQEFSKLSVRQPANEYPGEQLRKVLHESQRKGFRAVDVRDSRKSIQVLIPPEKPRRSFTYDPSSADASNETLKEVTELKYKTIDVPYGVNNFPPQETLNAQNLKTSPWDDINPDPTVPTRADSSLPFGYSQQYTNGYNGSRERQSSDEGHCTLGYRSRSTSSELVDESENPAWAPVPRKRIVPLRKQQAVPESTAIEKQQSSVDTVDSGVFSPGLKMDSMLQNSSEPSPLAAVGHPVSEGNAAIRSSPRPVFFNQRSSSDSRSSENEIEQQAHAGESVLFRKVTLKKRKASLNQTTALKEKRPATSESADESGNSLWSSPHGRMRMRNRSLSGGSEDGRQMRGSLPQISVSECAEKSGGPSSVTSSEKDSCGMQEDEIDQAFAYHCRSQMSLSSFGVRSESVTSVYSAAGGGRYGTVTVTGEVLFGFNYLHKSSLLEINVQECRNLAPVDIKRGRSDPYVKVYLLPDRTKSGKRKTKVKKHTLNPVFDECLKFHITINDLVNRTLWFSVWHSDRFGRNDFLGEVMLPLNNEIIENSGAKWYPLQERLEALETPISYKGDLILALKYAPPDVTSSKFHKRTGFAAKGSLHILVREARNLMATRSNGTSDPFCKSYLLPDKSKSGKQKTPVLKKSCNPKWNHTFIYDDVSIDDLRERCLELTIWDYDKITSNDFLGGVRLCLGTGKFQGRDIDWMDSVGEERSLWYTMLERPNTWVDGSLLLRSNMQGRRTV